MWLYVQSLFFFLFFFLSVMFVKTMWWKLRKEEHSKYTQLAREIQLEGANKLSGGLKPPEEDKPFEGDKLAGEDKPLEGDKLTEENKPPRKANPAEEGKPSEKDHKSSDIDKPSEEDKPLGGVKHAEEAPSIPEISKVLLMFNFFVWHLHLELNGFTLVFSINGRLIKTQFSPRVPLQARLLKDLIKFDSPWIL